MYSQLICLRLEMELNAMYLDRTPRKRPHGCTVPGESQQWYLGLVSPSQHHLCPTSGARLHLPFAGYRPISPGRSLWGGWATHNSQLWCLWGNSPPEESQVCNSPTQWRSQTLAQSRQLRHITVFKSNFWSFGLPDEYISIFCLSI